MKKQILSSLLLLAVIGTTFLTACKKDKGNDSVSIVGTWTIDQYDYVEFYDGNLDESTDEATQGDYIKFNANGSLEAHTDGELYIGTWIQSNNKIIMAAGDLDVASDGYEIKKLTANELVVYAKETDGDDYTEVTIHLSR